MSQTITLQPVTRIEGHLALHAETEPAELNGKKGFKVTKAFCDGEMFRGIENILVGRDPLGRAANHAADLRRLPDLARPGLDPRPGDGLWHQAGPQRPAVAEPGPGGQLHPVARAPFLPPGGARLRRREGRALLHRSERHVDGAAAVGRRDVGQQGCRARRSLPAAVRTRLRQEPRRQHGACWRTMSRPSKSARCATRWRPSLPGGCRTPRRWCRAG